MSLTEEKIHGGLDLSWNVLKGDGQFLGVELTETGLQVHIQPVGRNRDPKTITYPVAQDDPARDRFEAFKSENFQTQ